MSGLTLPATSHPELRSARDVARHYLGDIVYGANDGLITTFAIVAGVAGAALSARIVIVLGIANLVADGFSMAASNYLAIRSRGAVERAEGVAVSEPYAVKHAVATLLAFVLAGAVPLIAFLTDAPLPWRFTLASGLTFATLFVVGAVRSLVVHGRWWLYGAEMLVVGAAAAGVAYGVGMLLAAAVPGASV